MSSSMIINFKDFIYEELDYNSMDYIINRIRQTGYISKSIEEKIIRISGGNDIMYKIKDRSNKLLQFYKKANLEYIEDIFESILADSPYTVSIKYGYFFDYTFFHWNYRSSINTSTLFNITDEINEQSLTLMILESAQKLNNDSKKLIDSQKEEDKQKEEKLYTKLRKRYIPDNYFTQVRKINPIFEITLIHKEREDYWMSDWEYVLDQGITRTEFYSGKWSKEIQNSTRLKSLGNFRIDHSGYYDSFTHYNNEEDKYGYNSILLNGRFYLKFNI